MKYLFTLVILHLLGLAKKNTNLVFYNILNDVSDWSGFFFVMAKNNVEELLPTFPILLPCTVSAFILEK